MAPRSRASTPHRLTRSSMIHPSPGLHHPISTKSTPLDEFTPNFIELNDSLGDLDKNLQDVQRIHEDLTSFNESFASFLYGLQVNAYIVEFGEIPEDLKQVNNDVEINKKILKLQQELDGDNSNVDRERERERVQKRNSYISDDETMLTNDGDGSFMIQPKSRISQPSVSQGTKRQTGGVTRGKDTTRTTQRSQSTRPSTTRPQQRSQSTRGGTTSSRSGTTGTTNTTNTIRKDSKIPVGKRKTGINQRPPFR